MLTALHVTEGAEACPPLTTNWYALWVWSNREFQVQKALERQGFDEFLPVFCEQVSWSDRKQVTKRPLIPGYVFARLARRDFPAIARMSGVVEILPTSIAPIAIADAEIFTLRRVAVGGQRPQRCKFVAGETVTVGSGPYAGITGVVNRTKGATRLVIRIQQLNFAASVELDADTVFRTQKEKHAA